MQVTESAIVTMPGLYRMSAAEYHAGPCPAPELSASIAKIIVRETPLHAWTRHSKLGRAPIESEDGEEADEPKSKAIQDFGSAAHKLALGYGRDIAWVDPAAHIGKKGGVPKGWTNDSIREARSEAQGAGHIPMLLRYQPAVEACAKAMQERAEAWLGLPVAECLREVVMCWQDEAGIWCKGMADIMRPDMLRKADLKSTLRSVSPESVARHLYAEDMEVQAAFYERGSAALDPSTAGRSRFAFIFGEQRAPFIASPPIYPSEAGMQLGRWQVENAITLWAGCLQDNKWPAWQNEAYEAMPPAWKLSMMGNDL